MPHHNFNVGWTSEYLLAFFEKKKKSNDTPLMKIQRNILRRDRERVERFISQITYQKHILNPS